MYDYVENGTESELWHIGRDKDISTLEHHGILGMKWGVRRYQNEDGTLTEAGKKKYGSDEGSNKRSSGKKHGSAQDMTDEELQAAIRRKKRETEYNKLYPDERLKAAQDLADTSDRFGKALSDLGNRIPNTNIKPDYNKDLSAMTDADLRNAINRMNMEKQYRTLLAEQASRDSKSEQAKGKVKEFLAIAGPTVAMTGTAVGTALAIYGAVHKK